MKTLYYNGTVVTMDMLQPQAEALVTEENLIIGLGSEEEMQKLAGDEANKVDMQGGALFPGFNETHNHLSMYAVFNQYAYLGDCETISDLQETIQQHYKETETELLIAYCYDDTKLRDGRQIVRADLDKISKNLPVIVFHISAHLGFLNSKALDYFGINSTSISPVGGEIHLDQKGEPTGRLDEVAWFNLASRLPSPPPELFPKLLEQAIADFNAQGITGVHDAAIGIEGDHQAVLDAYQGLAKENQLNVRAFLSAMPDVFEQITPEPCHEFSSMVAVGGVKLFIDGSIQAETAALLEPYHDQKEWKSELVMPVNEFEALVLKYHQAGHHLSIHGNGDAAIETIINAVEKAQSDTPRPHARHMLIHSQMAHKTHLKRMKKAGIIPSFFAMHVHNWGDRHYERFLGPERANRLDPAGEAEQMGLPFTLHVDSPVLKPQVLTSIETAITRKTSSGRILGAEQATTQYGAIAAYTSMASLCSHSEKYRGTLTIGKYADMVVLDQDISCCQPEQISATKILYTIIDGRMVYQNS